MKTAAPDLFGPAGTPTVAVVGAGFGGLGTGVALKRAGIHTFTIFERSEGVGGTWWDNHYPGAEVDVDSYVYSFPFKRHDWTRTHARQPELQAYLERVAREYDLMPHLRLGTTVERAVWDEQAHVYHLTLGGGEELDCHVLVCATGFLNYPRYPDWPGLETFTGPKFHTSRWEHEHDLSGKTVAVVGTGSTASQVVPELAPVVGKLYQFQREPGWVVPKGDRDYTQEERNRIKHPWHHRRARARWFWEVEKRLWCGAMYKPGSPMNKAAEDVARAYIASEFADRPDLAAALTPDYPIWGKRTIISSSYYPALKHPNVELVPQAVVSVTRDGVVDAAGVERKVDVLVMATGFQPTNYLARIEVVGVDGRTLRECWGGEPRAFLGITVPNFPNLYILYGPGTNGGEIASNLRNQARYARRAVKRMIRDGVTAIEVKQLWADVYHAWLQSKMTGSSFAVSNNYFRVESGKVVTQWPYSANVYGVMTRLLGRWSETTRRRAVAAAGAPADAPVTNLVEAAPAGVRAETAAS